MGHEITGLVARGAFEPDAVARFEMLTKSLDEGLSLAFIDHYFSAYWQAKLGETGFMPHKSPRGLLIPDEAVLFRIARELLNHDEPHFAIIATNYFGGVGTQWAGVYRGTVREPNINSINDALRSLGVVARDDLDEFDTVGLSRTRHPPDELDIWCERAEELGV